MNIQYVRLDDGVCEILNRMAEDQRRRVSELVNEILKDRLEKMAALPIEEPASEMKARLKPD